jgi:hypothetical protein
VKANHKDEIDNMGDINEMEATWQYEQCCNNIHQ